MPKYCMRMESRVLISTAACFCEWWLEGKKKKKQGRPLSLMSYRLRDDYDLRRK